MGISWRAGSAITLLSVTLGLTGCMTTGEPSGQAMRTAYRLPQRGGGSAYTPDAGPGEIQQTSYMAPRARIGGVVQAQAEDKKPEPPVIGGIVTGPVGDHLPPPPLPTEKAMSTHPPHRVAPPDSLYIEALRMVPRGPYRLEPLEVLGVEVLDSSKRRTIEGNFTITPEGTINLGQNYGRVNVRGLTVDQAQAAIRDHLRDILKNPTVNVVLVQMRGMQVIRGEHLVRPDGTVHLGMYGSVYVAGMTLGQVKTVLETHLAHYLVDPQISVDVFAYNSRRIYIIADGAGYGQQVVVLPATGNETVLDAISRVQGLPSVSSQRRIWVSRPGPAGNPYSQILPVDWKAIVQAGRTETNWQLLPGDRVYISGDPCIALYNYIDKLVSPIERVLNTVLIGSTTFNSLRGGAGAGNVLITP